MRPFARRRLRTTRPARVAILGLGMMGGSLGLALKRARPATEVAGYDAAPGVAERARARYEQALGILNRLGERLYAERVALAIAPAIE